MSPPEQEQPATAAAEAALASAEAAAAALGEGLATVGKQFVEVGRLAGVFVMALVELAAGLPQDPEL